MWKTDLKTLLINIYLDRFIKKYIFRTKIIITNSKKVQILTITLYNLYEDIFLINYFRFILFNSFLIKVVKKKYKYFMTLFIDIHYFLVVLTWVNHLFFFQIDHSIVQIQLSFRERVNSHPVLYFSRNKFLTTFLYNCIDLYIYLK